MLDRSCFVYTRDASWYASGGQATKWHWPSIGEDGMSACGRAIIDDHPMGLRNPDEVRPRFRCRANGCRQMWSEHERARNKMLILQALLKESNANGR